MELPELDAGWTVVERFEAQARLLPDHVVVESAHKRVTYAELDRAANKVAHSLLDRFGPSPEPVALSLSHDVEMVAAVLGVLKSGKFYVPLDPSFPADRLRQMVTDSGSRVVVTTRDLESAGRAVMGEDATVLILEDELRGSSHGSGNPRVAVTPDHDAYLIYTSGSTGRPKAVILNHRSVARFSRVLANLDYLSPDDVLSGFQSIGVNALPLSMYVSLLTGARLLLAEPKRLGMGLLGELMRKHGVTCLSASPALFRALMEADTIGFPTLRVVRFNSAPVPGGVLKRFKGRLAPHGYFHNVYGMTEISAVCSYLLTADSDLPEKHVPIGYETEAAEILLVDDRGKRVMEGEVGEIVVRSPGITPGYWNHPDLTAERIWGDPNGAPDRYIRTGDLGVRDENGCLFHRGRKDFQVKVKGFRVELQEVEDQLGALVGVRAAATRAWEGAEGETYLAAYVVPEGQMPATGALRRGLAEKLPAYMIPAVFVPMSELPMTPSGKLDRNALREPAPARGASGGPDGADRLATGLERAITLLWADVLQVRPIGLRDEFLDLGGDSLKAFRLLNRLEARFKVKVLFTEFYEASTVEAQAALVLRSLLT